jgi:hypothetical protein
MTHKSFKWPQVNAWRLSQHGLSPRLKRSDYLQAASRTGGIQAQVMSAAEMALGTRVEGLSPGDVGAALWQDRTLVKTWAMRATLHLLSARDLPLYVAARGIDEPRNWVGYFDYYGISEAGYQAYLSAAPETLGSEPLTREQFAEAIVERTGVPELRDLMVSKGWGTPLKPLAWRGDLCFGPNDGRNVTFINPKKWLGEWVPVEPYPALQEIARRYLRAYGPATVEEFALWWGMRLTPARKLFKSLGAELEPVEVESRPALALRESLEPMSNLELPGSVILLPLFDAYLMGIGRGADIEPLLPKAYQRLVYRPQGWISAVVLVDGYIRGVWETENRSDQTLLKVRMFSTPPSWVRKGIEAEAERLSAFLNTGVDLEILEMKLASSNG